MDKRSKLDHLLLPSEIQTATGNGIGLPASFFHFIQLAAVALSRPAVGIRVADTAEFVELPAFFPQVCRCPVFFIKATRLRCRTALIVQTLNLNLIG